MWFAARTSGTICHRIVDNHIDASQGMISCAITWQSAVCVLTCCGGPRARIL